MAVKGSKATAEEKKAREGIAAAYKRADWAFVITTTPRGGGHGRMVKRGE